MSKNERYLSPAETARRVGVSQKALRLYESHGLLAPVRTQAGWRVYGEREIARLHQILALKGLGLSLSRITQLLSHRPVALETILGAQEEALRREHARVTRALELVRKARATLDSRQALSIDDLIQLAKETTMSTRQQLEDMKNVFDPIVEKHFTADELTTLRQRSYDQAEASRGWESLMAEARRLMAKGDPTTPEAQDLAKRWKAQVALFTQGDPALSGKIKAVWDEAMADPKAAPKLPLNPEIFAFIEKAWKAAEAAGAR